MKKEYDVDAVIIGAGIVGMTTAIGLHNRGLKVVILECNKFNHEIKNPLPIETKVSAINRKSQYIFEDIDIWNSICDIRHSAYYKMNVWDQNKINSFTISANEVSQTNLGYIIESSVISACLFKKIQELGISSFDNSKITSIDGYAGEWLIQCDSLNIKSRLIIGADGSNSFVREKFDFETVIKPYNQSAFVATVATSKPHENTAYQRFMEDGVLAFLPLKDNHKSSIVWSLDNERAFDIKKLNNIGFIKNLEHDFQKHLGDMEILSAKPMMFELFSRHARNCYQPGVILIGDAAHTFHPLAGQGLNLGLKNAYELINIIANANNKNRDISSISTLNEYSRATTIHNHATILAMKGFKDIFCNDNDALKKIRNIGINAVNKSNLMKRILVKQALGI